LSANDAGAANLDEIVKQQFTGNFIDANDIRERGAIELEVASVSAPGSERDATNKVIDKIVLRFKGAKKALICNKTNLKIIAAQHGTKASQWVGKKVTLTVRYLEKAFGQRNVPVVRVQPTSDGMMTFGMRKNYGAERPFNE
jgi:hypothetical protein